jgi:hypothetical protein
LENILNDELENIPDDKLENIPDVIRSLPSDIDTLRSEAKWLENAIKERINVSLITIIIPITNTIINTITNPITNTNPNPITLSPTLSLISLSPYYKELKRNGLEMLLKRDDMLIILANHRFYFHLLYEANPNRNHNPNPNLNPN